MLRDFPKMMTIVASLCTAGAGLHLTWTSWKACEAIAATRTAEIPAVSAVPSPSIVTIDEVFVNVVGAERAHSLVLKLDLELFEESGSPIVDSRVPGIRHVIIQTAREQKFASLDSLAGKLYFKETLVSGINEFLGSPVVRDAHFASFYLQ